MGIEVILVLCIIGLALVLFVSEVIPIDLTAIIIMVLLMVFGLVTPEQGFSGFSNIATATILALLILSEGLRQTGVVGYIGEKLKPAAGKSKFVSMLAIMVTTAVLSAFMNNTAVVAIFIPVAVQLARHTSAPPSLYLIPLSFAAMAGGSLTLIGSSTNLLVEDIARNYQADTLEMFSFVAIGGLISLAVVLFFLLGGKFLLPKRKASKNYLTTDYENPEYITEIEVLEDSELVGKTYGETSLMQEGKTEVLNVLRKGRKRWLPKPEEKIEKGDIIVLQANKQRIIDIASTYQLSIKREVGMDEKELSEKGGALVEILLGPASDMAGYSLSWQSFKEKYDAIPIAIRKRNKAIKQLFIGRKLRFGDVLLVQARDESLDKLFESGDLVVLRILSEKNNEPKATTSRKGLLAAGITLLAVLLAALGILPIVISAWAGCVAMVLFGCLELKTAYKNVQWSVVFLLAGIIPLGVAMDNTGTTQLLADQLNFIMGGFGLHGVVATLFIGTALLTSIMSNNATAILITPIAIEAGRSMGLPIEPLLITVLLGANSSFITPVGYQTNTMVYGPGNYKFIDFVKVGTPLIIVVLALVTYFVPMLYGH